MNVGEFQQVLSDAIQHPELYSVHLCILCGEPAEGVSLFLPTEAMGKRLGQPKGKRRVFLYGCCHACLEMPGSGDRVEQRFLNSMQAQ